MSSSVAMRWTFLICIIAPVCSFLLRHPSDAQLSSKQKNTVAEPAPNTYLRQDDLEAWRFGIPNRFSNISSYSGHLPPKCPKDVSEDGPYFQEYVYPDKIHTICDYRRPCNRLGKNLERLNSIRGLLKQTKKLLNELKVEYALYGGSAIGQERCEDVLPWDVDCDVVVWEKDVHKIKAGDLDSQYTVMFKSYQNYAIPYVVADKKTGFYCDIFFMKYMDSDKKQIGFAWPWGGDYCPSMSNDHPFTSDFKRCDIFPADVVAPFVPCTLNGVEHSCMKDQLGYLRLKFGSGVTRPDVATNSSAKMLQLRSQAQ